MFLDGKKAIFRVALGVLKMNETALVNSTAFEELNGVLQQGVQRAYECDELIKVRACVCVCVNAFARMFLLCFLVSGRYGPFTNRGLCTDVVVCVSGRRPTKWGR